MIPFNLYPPLPSPPLPSPPLPSPPLLLMHLLARFVHVGGGYGPGLVRTSHCGRSLARPSLLPQWDLVWGPLYRGGGLQIIELCKSQLGKAHLKKPTHICPSGPTGGGGGGVCRNTNLLKRFFLLSVMNYLNYKTKCPFKICCVVCMS